ncbi:MAG: DUF3078 domain-containing protein [Candidatus Marinimicrobia bacterium]|nr:DUF3078 domain-containing protein [Candidatus Neomarinimicrobiota bacterium]MBT3633311.1 DUF3078 domain-containing protein [Candidatus Neomarinimicrobiota bacterium]MBT3681454.1 DUF3078 domain-containing protein [Candidatus Neomarinimicrobiota bacterium]MBT3758579.1 DUF3078 domain-containing protein [Candidatus Neomarinimicrobiota bacterium]MBT3894767.1 DUF3078 domain-containing protein [Candidatus Neomarinimicrobiota bacterium]
MRIFILLLLFSIFVTDPVIAEETSNGIHITSIGNLNLTQTQMDNWQQGGENTFAWQAGILTDITRETDRYNLKHSIKLAYGMSSIGDIEARKSIDELRLSSVLTFKSVKWANPYISIIGETQFSNGYEYTDNEKLSVSGFFDPGYFTESVGISYVFPFGLSTRLGLALKQTIADKYPITYTDDPETSKIEKVKYEKGLEIVGDYKKTFNESVNLVSRCELFSDLESFNKIDTKWETDLTSQLTEHFNVNFNLRLFYDSDISSKRQIRQFFSLGVNYTFL